MVRQRVSRSSHGPLSEHEANERICKQIQIIEDEANKEINIMSVQSTDSNEVLAREMASEPKEQIDEWVEKVRAFTERQTMIQSARLRRIAKLRVLEAFGNIREIIKEEARERIKEKLTGNSKECDELVGRMLYQGVVRLMEPTVLVHTTRPDIKKVEKHYAWVTKKYQEETNVKVKLLTSKHPLMSAYYGRIVLSDKKSTMFVDVNLHKNVDKIADEVFTHAAAVHGKYKNPFVLEIKSLRALGYKIMPKGPGITTARLDIIISTMHGDPRTQVPTICLIEESKKQVMEHEESITPAPARLNRRKVTIPFITPPPPGGMGGSAEPMMSVVPAKYMFRQQEEDTAELARTSKDLYNLENAASSMELTSHMESMAMAGHSAVWKNMPNKAKAMAQSPDRGSAKSRSIRSAGRPAPKGDTARTSIVQRSPSEEKPSLKDSSSKGTEDSPQSSSSPPQKNSITFSLPSDDSSITGSRTLDSETLSQNSAKDRKDSKK